ncbi:MTOR-associated protein MEAK7 [Hyalella azteca]|uniref:MTOR-associated protein MEAK7 n=1 Tax=Hyalella azteca TaxID=294128 RepID=A0A8B7N7N9_HYAAZ|nr:MTOR-associated protein MEAK7 [Hyalella azteca]
MGAEASKKSLSSDSHTLWMSIEEEKLINAHIMQITTEGCLPEEKILEVSSHGDGQMLAERFLALLKKWPNRGTDKQPPATGRALPSAKLLQVFIEILNPDPSIQTAVLCLLSGSDGGSVQSNDLVQAVALVIERYCRLASVAPATRLSADADSSGRVAREWLNSLLFADALNKKTVTMALPSTALSQAGVERWLQGHAAVYGVVQVTVMRSLVLPALTSPPSLFPDIIATKEMHVGLSAADILLLNTALPQQLRCQWRLLFCNHTHGDSFSILMKQIVGKGPTLVVVEDEEGNKFGGFASASWEVRPQFHGTAESFLFSINPYAGIYRSTGYNTNYQYLNFLENNTMPNGLGFGGRVELFGLFLSYDFGECSVAPSCTTFSSPALCLNATPHIRRLTVWGVGEEPKDSDDDDDDDDKQKTKKRSALDRNPEARAMLDMIGRTRASEGLREPEPEPE